MKYYIIKTYILTGAQEIDNRQYTLEEAQKIVKSESGNKDFYCSIVLA